MPAGSGPQSTTPITSGSITTGANSVTIITGTFNTGAATGVQITAYLYWTPSATQTITAKLFQGSGTGGTVVAPSGGLVETGTGTTSGGAAFTWIDTSAFAQNAALSQYTVGFTANTGTGTILYAYVTLETLAPLS